MDPYVSPDSCANVSQDLYCPHSCVWVFDVAVTYEYLSIFTLSQFLNDFKRPFMA